MSIYWILGQIIISIFAIILIHYLYRYLKDSLSNPIEYNYKKDLQEKYEKMYNALSPNENEKQSIIEDDEYSTLPNMEAELTHFLESKTI